MTIEAVPVRGARVSGVVLVLSGIAAFALLALHPNDAARDFGAMLKNEVATEAVSVIVHGGFVGVLAVQFVCFAVFSRRIDLTRPSAIAGLTFFALGTLFLSGALVLEGLVGPALAVRYLPKPDKIEFARASFVLLATVIGLFQPIGLGFQSAAIAVWGWALAGSGRRTAGVFAVLFGLALIAGVVAAVANGNEMPLVAVMLGTAGWAIGAGVAMARGA